MPEVVEHRQQNSLIERLPSGVEWLRAKPTETRHVKPGAVLVGAPPPRRKLKQRAQSDRNLRLRLLRLWGFRCAYCCAELTIDTMTFDHLEPLARGGLRRGFENLIPACSPCNHEKRASGLLLFLLRRAVS